MTEDPVSLEAPVGDGESNFADMVEDTNTRRPDDQVAGTRARAAARATRWRGSRERTRHVLEARFGLDNREPATLEQVGIGDRRHPRAGAADRDAGAARAGEPQPGAARLPARPRLNGSAAGAIGPGWHTTECELAARASGMRRWCSLTGWPTCGSARWRSRWRFSLPTCCCARWPGGTSCRPAIPAAASAGAASPAPTWPASASTRIVPARGGDVMKIYMAHRSMPGAAVHHDHLQPVRRDACSTRVIGPVLLIAAYSTGRIPHAARASATWRTWEWTLLRGQRAGLRASCWRSRPDRRRASSSPTSSST